MKQDEQFTPRTQEDSGSGENRDMARSENTTATSDMPGTEEATGSKQHLVNLHDMGTLGSRDNRAGGSGEHMERESTGDAIER